PKGVTKGPCSSSDVPAANAAGPQHTHLRAASHPIWKSLLTVCIGNLAAVWRRNAGDATGIGRGGAVIERPLNRVVSGAVRQVHVLEHTRIGRVVLVAPRTTGVG